MNEHHTHQPEREPAALQPKIWIGSLADYNAGRLHGDWFDAAVDDQQLLAEVHAMLHASPEPLAEEYAIFDDDEFGAFHPKEHDDLRTVAAVGRGIREHGPAFAVWAALHDADPDMLTQFEEAYIGHFDDADDWAHDALADVDAQLDQIIPDRLRGYVAVDYAGWLRDVELSGGLHIERDPEQSGVYLFHGY